MRIKDENYRNHRKIVVIDGKIGYTGGINIGDEYIGKNKKFGYWRDTHIRIEGTSVYMLQMIFFSLTFQFIADTSYSMDQLLLIIIVYLPSQITDIHIYHI